MFRPSPCSHTEQECATKVIEIALRHNSFWKNCRTVTRDQSPAAVTGSHRGFLRLIRRKNAPVSTCRCIGTFLSGVRDDAIVSAVYSERKMRLKIKLSPCLDSSPSDYDNNCPALRLFLDERRKCCR